MTATATKPTTTPVRSKASAGPDRSAGRRRSSTIIVTALLVVVALYFLIPVYWVFVASTKSTEDLFSTNGFWFAPTVFTGVSQAHRIAREEIFGPVLSVLTFRTPAEAVEKANNTPFGLSAGVWTEKGSRILWMAQRLRAGVVWANTFNKFDPTSPFGGYKESGYGREGGRHGLEGYLR